MLKGAEDSMFEKCKAVVILRPGKVEVRTIKLPPVTDDSLVVRSVCSSVSVGTEGNLYRGGNVSSWGGWYPMGQGVVGMMMAQLTKLRGAEITIADLYDKKLIISKSFADHTINARTEDVLERGRLRVMNYFMFCSR